MAHEMLRDAWQIDGSATAQAHEDGLVAAYLGRCAQRLVDLTEVHPGDRILDIACGTGVLARKAAERAGGQGRVAGLDLNRDMLALARRLAPGIEWREGDACATPFANASFDAVLNQMGLMFFPDPARALTEMKRVLAPGGRLAVAVPAPLSESPGYALFAAILRRHAGEEAAALLERYFAFGDHAGLARLARDVGLGGARIARIEGTMRLREAADLPRLEIRATPMSGLVDASAYAAIVAECETALASFRDPQGHIAFPLDASVILWRKV
ncbi:MAG: methyltransferase domain-containing protein [Salinarimonadaceae bacterium]|nr:MAG: methyltransferase domain-containing protein [Salinarimonadaceae bacterium]